MTTESSEAERGKVIVRNETAHDGRTVNAIVRWALREKELNGYVWSVRIAHTRCGTIAGSWYTDRRHAVVRIGKTFPAKPHVYKRRDVPDPPILTDWRQALVWILGHELEHARQQRAQKPFRESENEWAAYRLWRTWIEKNP